MESVLSLLLWGGLIFLMVRFGCGSHMFGHGSHHKKESVSGGLGGCCGPGATKHAPDSAPSQGLKWEAPEKDVDPVCGKAISTSDARPSLHDGQVYYFCSRECREAFEAAPEHYVGLGEPHKAPRLDHTPAKGGNHG